jgi:hypothetical protein
VFFVDSSVCIKLQGQTCGSVPQFPCQISDSVLFHYKSVIYATTSKKLYRRPQKNSRSVQIFCQNRDVVVRKRYADESEFGSSDARSSLSVLREPVRRHGLIIPELNGAVLAATDAYDCGSLR